MKHAHPTVLYAGAVRDATGIDAAPGAVLVQNGRVVAAGEPASLPRALAEQAEVVNRPNDLLLPALVNAHTHLELTDVGPRPYDPAGGFMGWVKTVRASMPRDRDARERSAKRGAQRCKQSGVQAIGDIASASSFQAIRSSRGLAGRTYVELFGLGPPFDAQALDTIASTTTGLQPHAPYSAGPSVYEAASKSGRPVCTHLAETRDEVAFVKQLTGPHLDYLKSLGKWDDAFAAHYGQGLSPVAWMRPYLEAAAKDGGWLVAHCNYVGDDDIKILADTNTSVAYCPIASEYFGHQDHRYREMLDAGINVCLGTDSIVGTDPDDPEPLGLFSAMRRLYQRDQADPQTLLAMATVNGARALRLDAPFATLKPGAPARFACLPIAAESDVDPLIQVLTGQDPVEAISLER